MTWRPSIIETPLRSFGLFPTNFPPHPLCPNRAGLLNLPRTLLPFKLGILSICSTFPLGIYRAHLRIFQTVTFIMRLSLISPFKSISCPKLELPMILLTHLYPFPLLPSNVLYNLIIIVHSSLALPFPNI